VLGLSNLSLGASYASVGIEMRSYRDRAAKHLAEAHDMQGVLQGAFRPRSKSVTTKEGKTAWHLGANLVEQYAPILFEPVNAQMLEHDRRARAANDAVLAEDPKAALAQTARLHHRRGHNTTVPPHMKPDLCDRRPSDNPPLPPASRMPTTGEPQPSSTGSWTTPTSSSPPPTASDSPTPPTERG
jgi:hypothetical protein